MKWIALIAIATLTISCFYSWVFIAEKNITITGVSAEALRLGKPAYFHFLLAAIYLVFNFTMKIWAKRWNLLVAALNLAWAIRNFLIISSCAAGECPEKRIALWLLLVSSIIMLITAMFPGMKLEEKK